LQNKVADSPLFIEKALRPLFCFLLVSKRKVEEKVAHNFTCKRGQIFQIKKVLAETRPFLFQLCDLMKDDLPGFFYAEQLTKASYSMGDHLFEVEEVLKTKVVKKKKWLLCKFMFYPAKFNQWIPEENIEVGK
jgi:hypothetical protein